MEAADRQVALDILKKMGLIPLDIAESGKTVLAAKPGTSLAGRLPFSGSISQKEITIFTRQFATLLESGLPIARALHFMSGQAEKQVVREMIHSLEEKLNAGATLSSALSEHPRLFDRLYLSMVQAGETGGIIETVMDRLASMREAQEDLRSKVKGALIYPAFMFLAMAASIVVLLVFVVPRFATLFADMGQALPLPTMILMELGTVMRTYWWFGIMVLIAIVVGLQQYGKTAEGRLRLDILKFRLPVMGNVFLKVSVARFSRTLGTLIHSGVHLIVALQSATGVAGNEVIIRAVGTSTDKIREGKKMGDTFAETGVFPAYATEMIILGEESGTLGKMLVRVAETYEKEVNDLVKNMTSILEPFMILVMGGFVAFVVMAMLLPIFQMNLMAG